MSDDQPLPFSRPLYVQARDAIANKILSGEWKPGTAIPNETQLAYQFGLSVGTIRKALDILTREHIVNRRQGRGTFVTDFSENKLQLTQFVSLLGHAIKEEKRAKSVVVTTANAEVAQRLGITVGDEVIRIDRLRLANGRPFATEVAYLPGKRFPYRDHDLAVSWLSALAQSNGFLIKEAKEIFAVDFAIESDAKDLRVKVGAPLAILDREVYSDGMVVIEWRIARCDLSNMRIIFNYG